MPLQAVVSVILSEVEGYPLPAKDVMKTEKRCFGFAQHDR